ncbi:MAG: histidine kinase, partial [Euryarchaeota archaeon]|nr:histidine kinase [Euryarchaeota archaeon]
KKIDSIQYLFFLLFIAFVMLGYVVAILNLGGVLTFFMKAPVVIGLLSLAAFFPGVMLGVYRDDTSFLTGLKRAVEYWAYCLYLIPLFFAAFLHMVTRKDRKWAKTHHGGDES